MRVLNANDPRVDNLVSVKLPGNLAMVYSIRINENHASFITKEMARDFGYDLEKVYDAAEINTPKLMPATFESLDHAILVLPEDRATLDNIEDNLSSQVFILSNKTNIYGASALFYPGTTKKIAEIIGDDFYAIPSSLHEFMICPASLNNPVYLEDVLVGANATVVKPEDVLGDKVLYCNAAENYISIANPDFKVISNEIDNDFEIE